MEDQSDSSDSDEDDSNEESDDDFDYQTSESGDSVEKMKKKQQKSKNKNDTTKDFHAISSFPDSGVAHQPNVTMSNLAFGTNHAAAISEQGLLYTWGHNEV